MNKITVDGVEFVETRQIYPIESGVFYKSKWYTPINYKVGDWIIFKLGAGIKDNIRKVISQSEYSIGMASFIYGSWMTESATLQQVLNIVRKATESEIKEHLAKLAKEKGLVKGVKVKRLNDTSFVTIVQEDDDYYLEQDEYCKSGIVLYSKGQWVTKIEEPKFTFGGHNATCELFNGTRVKVVCKGEVGYHTQIEDIINSFTKSYKFGNVELKKFDPPKTITIGCLTGTYKELYDIYEHCKSLLK